MKFDEFEFENVPKASERLDLFGIQVKNHKAQAVVIGYGGKNTESNQARNIAWEIEEYLTTRFEFTKYVTIAAVDGGHRSSPTVELFVKPDSCSPDPKSSPSLTHDDVVFGEEVGFFDKPVIRKSSAQLRQLISTEVHVPFPPAAKAVRVQGRVVVLLIVDEEGQVSNVKALDGHPLLRTASELSVRQSTFRAIESEGKPSRYGGKLVIAWNFESNQSEVKP